MNEVFLIGKVITEVEFKFIINAKNISIAKFNIETTDKQIIKVEAYNEQADSVFRRLRKEDNIIINGYITTKGTVVLMNAIEKVNKKIASEKKQKKQLHKLYIDFALLLFFECTILYKNKKNTIKTCKF